MVRDFKRRWPARAALGLACVGASLLGGANATFAAPIPHGDRVGATVDYLNIQEESGSDAGAELFGAPTISSDSLDFNPTNFAASASNGATDTTDSTLGFTIVAHPGKAIKSVSIVEAGDASLSGFSNDAQASVTARVTVEVLEINGSTAVSYSTADNLAFSPNGGSYLLSAVGSPTFNTAWDGNLLVDVTPLLPSPTDFASKVQVTLFNVLTATSQDGTSAFIQKKDADASSVSIDAVTVPEPAAALAALFSMAIAATCRRRS
ncbi:MAG: hypothetical protein KDA61_20615 [Planctomycetales bacterium]|nr:hypothetical protein [Planctomycetales bacterium]